MLSGPSSTPRLRGSICAVRAAEGRPAHRRGNLSGGLTAAPNGVRSRVNSATGTTSDPRLRCWAQRGVCNKIMPRVVAQGRTKARYLPAIHRNQLFPICARVDAVRRQATAGGGKSIPGTRGLPESSRSGWTRIHVARSAASTCRLMHGTCALSLSYLFKFQMSLSSSQAPFSRFQITTYLPSTFVICFCASGTSAEKRPISRAALPYCSTETV